MLTSADEFPIHQTPEPIAYSGTDRNFYDRYFFNGYGPDGSEFFAVAFGVYPQLNIADAHFAVIRDGVEHCVHASRHLDMERMDLRVGPIAIEVLEPLRSLKVTIAPTDGIAAELVFTGRTFPIEEPRFTHRLGPRSFMDYTRMTQNGRYAGWIEVDGRRLTLAEGAVGTRDRSWGVRPIGVPDPQPLAPLQPPQFFWLWSPCNFASRNLFFHLNADADGRPWNTRAVLIEDAEGPGGGEHAITPEIDLVFHPGTRHAQSARLQMTLPPERQLVVDFKPIVHFQMRGIGYGHPDWRHGDNKGELAVQREDIRLDAVDPRSPHEFHIQAVSQVTIEEAAHGPERGIGVLEQLIIGRYAPYGFQDFDHGQWSDTPNGHST
jgi:hypothetical protein